MEPEYLFHYTNAQAILGIIRSRTIWASDSQYLNDGFEGKLIPDLLTQISERENPHYPVRQRRALDEHMRYGKVFLLASFSRKPDMLTQFRMYCPPRGGFVIGFPTSYLQQCGQLLDVVYDQAEHHARCADYFSRFMRAVSAHDDGRMLPDELALGMAADRKWLDERCEMSIACKAPEFSIEEEVRLLKWNTAPTHIRAAPGGNLFIPYAEIDLPNDPIQVKIGAGPGMARELAMQSVSWLSRACAEAGTRWSVDSLSIGKFGFRELW